jgi:hypothetical protein
MTTLPRDDSAALPQRRFASKRDPWVVVVLWGTTLGLVFASFQVAGSPTPLVFRALFILVCILSAVLPPWILHGTSYLLTDEALSIRCGPFRHRVLVNAIQEVTPSRNPVASPACSLDRLHIKYRGSRDGILVSPADKRSFLQDLASRDSQLSLRGDGIVRSA